MNPKDDAPLVYSTDKPYEENRSQRSKTKGKGRKKHKVPAKADPKDGIIRVRREKSGRGGKTVTTITGLTGDVKAIAKKLKQQCGGGGAVKNGQVEIQGDHVDVIIAALEKQGLKAVRAGG